MTTTYTIDFSEPLKTGFVVNPGSYNGPGGNLSSTSLRLYGRGAVEWGEGVNEDLVRLSEHFASATPPPNPITGQMWAETRLYHYDGTDYWRWNITLGSWQLLTPQPTTTIPAETIGNYYIAGGTLYGWYLKSPAVTGAWHSRAYSSGVVKPATPEVALKVYNAFASTWTSPQTVAVAPTVSPPSSPSPGSLWFDTTVASLKVYDSVSASWLAIATGSTPITGTLNLGGNLIINVADGTNPTDALNLRTGDARYVNVAGDTMTGDLDLGGTHRVTNLATPVAGGDAATKTYVDTAVSTLASSANVFSNPVGAFGYTAGDIAIAGGKIYIALLDGTSTVPGGNWKQVWPATYS